MANKEFRSSYIGSYLICKVYSCLVFFVWLNVDALIALRNEPDCQSAYRRGAIAAIKPQLNPLLMPTMCIDSSKLA